MISSKQGSNEGFLDRSWRWLSTINNMVANRIIVAMIIIIAIIVVSHGKSPTRTDSSNGRAVIMSRGQWNIPLETVQCLSRSSTKKTMILGRNYSDDAEIIALFSKPFGALPIRVDDPSCTYVYFTAPPPRLNRSVTFQGQPAIILASVGVCEWATPPEVNPNQCSQKNIWYFQEKIEPAELVTIAFRAFVEPQDSYWKAFYLNGADEEHEPCTSANTKSIFFPPESVPADEPLVVKTTIVDLIRPEDWSRARVSPLQPKTSRYAVAHVDKVIKGAIWPDTTALFINATVGRCVHPLKVGDTGILIGSANDVSDGIVRFFPRLSSRY
jgi:hypothetical protein